MKKKQLFAGALAAAMMTASLAGCGGAASSAATSTTGGDTAGSTASADTNSGVVEVTIPSFKTGENVGAVFFEPQVERFNEKYAGKYKINLESVPQDSIFNDRIKQLAQQNKLPVLVEGGDPDWVKNVVIPNGLAYDLTDWIDATPAIKDVLIDDSREYCSNEDGRVMVMPLATVRPIGFFYNSAMWSTDADISAMSMDEFVSALGDQKIAFSTAENGWVPDCAGGRGRRWRRMAEEWHRDQDHRLQPALLHQRCGQAAESAAEQRSLQLGRRSLRGCRQRFHERAGRHHCQRSLDVL